MNKMMMRKTGLISAVFITVFSLFVSCKSDNSEKAKADAWNTVKTINRHWAITENMDSLALFLHNDMLMIHPGANDRLQGKNHIIESYKGYAEYAQTISLKELDPLVQLYNGNQTAVVTYYYDLKIKTPKGEVQQFAGRDMYTLIHENGRWLAVAQHFSPMPK